VVRILNRVYTVNIYKRPVCTIEDILHLEIVIGSVNANELLYILEEKLKLLTGYLRK